MFVLLLSAIGLKAENQVNVQEMVFSHIKDSYSWHISKIFGQEVSVPLPVIVKDARGWDLFSSEKITDGKSYDGYYISTTGKLKGKLVEKDATGAEIRPFDISMTKDVCGLLLACVILLIIVLTTANWYRRHPGKAPGGFIGAMEWCVMAVNDSVVKECIGKGYEKFSPYLLTVFFFILLNNLLGLIPIFPGGANVTGNIAITMTLALCTFVAVNLFAPAKYWKSIFWPDMPLFLKFPLPLMPLVEVFGVFTKPFSLMIRLFANIMAGHTIIIALTSLVFISATMGVAINAGMTVISVIFTIFMNLLELLVACLQAYIFTILSASYIGLARHPE
jgi:F-type H+-transporting ATPase subunit a